MRIVVTGATGFLGRHLLPVLHRAYRGEITGISRKDYDLTAPDAVRRMFQDLKPDVLIHLAAYVGGIGANRDFPADFFFRNTLLTSLVFEAAARLGVQKLIYPMGGCSYPAGARSPIDESQMWEGYPQPESAPYSIAKKTGLVASQSYRRQYGLNSVVIIPGNMYGEYDNFRLRESHVVPAMIRRFHEAKLTGVREVVMWGSGAPVRDFVYAGDVAATIPFFIDHYDSSEPVNLSSGTTTSIRELAEAIGRLTGYKGDIVWDSTKPDGQMVKIFDVSRMKSLGLSCPTSLETGLSKTITWFQQNFESHADGIRLTEAVGA
jgi:GDP-L-fucose synthase